MADLRLVRASALDAGSMVRLYTCSRCLRKVLKACMYEVSQGLSAWEDCLVMSGAWMLKNCCLGKNVPGVI